MTRSKYFKRKHIRAIFVLWMKEWLFNTTVAIVLAVTIILTWRVFNPPIPFTAQADAVAALRMPHQAMSNLYALSQWHDVPFYQVLAIYAVANDFFPQGASPPEVELDILKKEYVTGFNKLRRQYASKDIEPYFELFRNLVSELEYFPVPGDYEYMFSDTWGKLKGTAILDRENIRGRIPVLSMTEGHILQAGWHPHSGYHVVVITSSGNRIMYAHLDKLEEGVATGRQVAAGQGLGAMGSSGEALLERPVHLHIAISPQVPFAEDFWINPYPLLRHVEEKMYIFPFMVHTKAIEEPLYTHHRLPLNN